MQYDGHVLTLLEDAEVWNEENLIDVRSRSADKPRMESCEHQNGTKVYIRALQAHSHGVAIIPDLFSLRL